MNKRGIKVFAALLVVAGIAAIGYMGYSMVNAVIVNAFGNHNRAEVVGEAPKDVFKGFESFTAGDSAFDVGINVYGKTIFVDNAAALKSTKEKCANAIDEMRSQASELRGFKKSSIHIYADYIWQINWDDVDEEVQTQKQFLSRFLEYYKNGDPQQ